MSFVRRPDIRVRHVAAALAGVLTALVTLPTMSGTAWAQAPEPATRQAAIEQAQAEKAKALHPYVPNRGERLAARLNGLLTGGTPSWHPFLDSAYAGGGFAFGAGYMHHVSPYNTVDVRGSYTLSGYKRAEVAFAAPRLFQRRGELSVVGGWREATQVGFYGLGTDTSKDDRRNYGFQQPYASAVLSLQPTRRLWLLRGGVEVSRWSQQSGTGSFPSVEAADTPATLPGLGAEPTYVHSQGTVGFDWRPSPGYARRGGFYGITVHDYTDKDKEFGFEQVDYDLIQHVPILREAWVISLHGAARTAFEKGDQAIPFFMLPALGGGSNLRGFQSWRFRDRNSLFVQAEWRIMVNRFFDTAVFYDAGKVTHSRSDLDFTGLKSNYGFAVRFHGPLATALRVELARSRDGTSVIFGTGPAF
jgi:hypothetical protein